jgi:hypothetical protein
LTKAQVQERVLGKLPDHFETSRMRGKSYRHQKVISEIGWRFAEESAKMKYQQELDPQELMGRLQDKI